MLQVALRSLNSGNVPLTTSSAGILACMVQSEDTRTALLTAKPAVMPLLLGLFVSTSPSLLASAAGEAQICAHSTLFELPAMTLGLGGCNSGCGLLPLMYQILACLPELCSRCLASAASSEV